MAIMVERKNIKWIVALLLIVLVAIIATLVVYPKWMIAHTTKGLMQDADNRHAIFHQGEVAKKTQADSSKNSSAKPGTMVVTAALLNIRQDGSINQEPIGLLNFNAPVKVIDTSNASWYKIELELDGMRKTKEGEYTSFKDSNGNEIFRIMNKYLNDSGLARGKQYYVSRQYVESSVGKVIDVPHNPQKPFVYGILFYDRAIADMIKHSVWSAMSKDLKRLGYDGIKVVPVNRNNFAESVKQGNFDAVECSPADFLAANKDGKKLEAFAQVTNKLDGNSTDYEGIIIVNKNSGITRPKDLVGKTIYTNQAYSESGYKYQQYYLKKRFGVDIEDCKLVSKVPDNLNHYDILLRVAKGEAPAGFVGDFTMFSESFHEAIKNAEKIGIKIESAEDLQAIRNNLYIIQVGEKKIPNNPHAVKIELMKDAGFVRKLGDTMKNAYDNHRQDFGLVSANSGEYDFLSAFE